MFELVSIEYIGDARLQVRFVGEEQGHEVNELIKVEIFCVLVNYVKGVRDTLFIGRNLFELIFKLLIFFYINKWMWLDGGAQKWKICDTNPL